MKKKCVDYKNFCIALAGILVIIVVHEALQSHRLDDCIDGKNGNDENMKNLFMQMLAAAATLENLLSKLSADIPSTRRTTNDTGE